MDIEGYVVRIHMLCVVTNHLVDLGQESRNVENNDLFSSHPCQILFQLDATDIRDGK